jgi:hypothetical protein
MADEVCSFSECGRPVRSLGLCWTHRMQQSSGKPLTPIRAWRPQTQRNDLGEKLCRTCLRWLAEAAFGASKRSTDGLAELCRRCSTDKHRLHNYGITAEQYDAMLAAQGGGCAICGEQCTSGRRLAVDHDHACCPGDKTCGKCVRGLLCGPCNQGIGKLRDSPRLLIAAASYLT